VTHSNNRGDRGVCLVGFMGAGKTSVGLVLAQLLGWRFTDLDDVVEAREHRRIAEIFRDSGESAFRQAERSALQQILSRIDAEPLVLALGGGAFVQTENAKALRQAGMPVVFLDATVEELHRRCAPSGDQRPLFQDQERFRKLYEERHSSYMNADLRVETDGRTVEQVASEVALRLGLRRI
jgi:shikimate kinase